MEGKKILRIPAGQRIIEALQYVENMDLTEVYVPEGVEWIRPRAFQMCKNLRTVHLPQSLTHIEMKVFEDCPLEDIYYAGTREQWDRLEISPVRSGSIIGARKHFLGEPTYGKETSECSGKHSGECVRTGKVRPQIDVDALGEDREDQILEKVRSLIAEGGDGRLHVVVPGLCMEDVLTKSGDSQLIIFPQGSTMMLDTGFMANWLRVKRFLETIGLTHLDYMAFSHGHKDHVGNCEAIAEFLYGKGGSIRHLWWTGQKFGNIVPVFINNMREKGTQIDEAVRSGRKFEIDGVDVRIMGPSEGDLKGENVSFEGCNGQSMIMKLTYGGVSCLMAGDLFYAQEYVVIERWGEKLRADIVKTNHHGNFTSNSKRWLDTVKGKIYYSCSIDNGNALLVEDLKERGAAQYTTGCQGTLLISASKEKEYEVMTQYDRGMQCIQRVN